MLCDLSGSMVQWVVAMTRFIVVVVVVCFLLWSVGLWSFQLGSWKMEGPRAYSLYIGRSARAELPTFLPT